MRPRLSAALQSTVLRTPHACPYIHRERERKRYLDKDSRGRVTVAFAISLTCLKVGGRSDKASLPLPSSSRQVSCHKPTAKLFLSIPHRKTFKPTFPSLIKYSAKLSTLSNSCKKIKIKSKLSKPNPYPSQCTPTP